MFRVMMNGYYLLYDYEPCLLVNRAPVIHSSNINDSDQTRLFPSLTLSLTSTPRKTTTSPASSVVAPPLVEVQLLVDPVQITRHPREDVGKASRRAVVDQPAHHPRDVEPSIHLAHQWATWIPLENGRGKGGSEMERRALESAKNVQTCIKIKTRNA